MLDIFVCKWRIITAISMCPFSYKSPRYISRSLDFAFHAKLISPLTASVECLIDCFGNYNRYYSGCHCSTEIC